MPAVTWLDVVKSELAKAPGKSVKDIVPAARKEWNLIKSGKHPTKTQGKMVIKRKKGSKKYPKKGKRSKTRKGRLDYETHKGDKDFHKRKHNVRKSRAPYKRRGKSSRKYKGGNKGGLRGIIDNAGEKMQQLTGDDSTTESMDPTANDSTSTMSDPSTDNTSTNDVDTSMTGGGRRKKRKSAKKSKKKKRRTKRC